MVVEPYEHGLNRVFIKTKDERIRGTFLAHADTHVVSDCNVALLARQLALHAHVRTLSLIIQLILASPCPPARADSFLVH